MEQRSSDFQIGIESPQQEEVVEMIEALDTYLNSVYPDGPNYLLDIESLTAESVSFLVARVDGQATGCGALLLDHHEYAEIKRMYVKPGATNRGCDPKRVGTACQERGEQGGAPRNRNPPARSFRALQEGGLRRAGSLWRLPSRPDIGLHGEGSRRASWPYHMTRQLSGNKSARHSGIVSHRVPWC